MFLDLARSAGYAAQGIDSVPEIARIARDDFDLLVETALTAARFSPLARGLEGPDLSRYRLQPSIRAGLTAIDVVGRITGLRSRLGILARTAAGPSMDRPGSPPGVRSTG